MPFDTPTPFDELLKSLQGRTALPTALNSAQMRALLSDLPGDIAQRALFVSTATNAWFLDQIGGLTTDLASGETDFATSRLHAQAALRALGYQPDEDIAGTIQDLASEPRLNLVLGTQLDMVRGQGQFIQSNDEDIMDDWPARELFRLEDRKEPRNWPLRWKQAGAESGDGIAVRVLEESGRMVARKDSGIWQALGDGAGGYKDTLGQAWSPFAFNTGMWDRDVARKDALELGVIERDTKVKPQKIPDFNGNLQMGMDLRDDLLREAILKQWGNAVEFKDGILVFKS
jgi:hypothetical protein